MKKFTIVFICFMLLANLEMNGQYLETFDTPNKGILSGPCLSSDGTTCMTNDFDGINWTIEGNLSGIGSSTLEDFNTNVSGVLIVNDVDEEACWVSPQLDIDIGVPVSFSLDLTWLGYDPDTGDGSDYIDIEYNVDGSGWTQVGNQEGGGGHTIEYIAGNGTDNPSYPNGDSYGYSGITGNTLQIRVCIDHNSGTSETTTLDNVQVSQAGVTVLPIELTYFEAKPINNQHIQLNWQTASELNNDYINIQRSADGLQFTTIGKVAGHGTTEQPQDYRFIDKNPLSGTNYYRLQQVDFDGQTAFHRVISIDFHSEEALDILLSPNPVKDIVQITLDRELAEATQFAIFDSQGTIIRQEVWPIGKRNQSLALSQYPSGIYYLQLIAGDTLYNRTFVKQ